MPSAPTPARWLPEVMSVKGPVPRDPGIGDVTVENGLDLDGSAPSERAKGALLGREMGIRHVNQPGVGDAEPAAVAVLEEHAAGEGPRVQVQHDVMVAQARIVGSEPLPRRTVLRQAAVAHPGPVGEVDHVLVADLPARNL